MDMVGLDVQFDDLPVLPPADDLECSLQFLLDLVLVENFASVFWSPDKVVFQIVEAM